MTQQHETPIEEASAAQLLDAILETSKAHVGDTVIARVDRATSAITDTQLMLTPQPSMGGDEPNRWFDDQYVSRLSAALRSIAVDMVPPRTWTGSGWSIPQDDLVTLVCRRGDAKITSTESQFHFGWRFSNHWTNAFDGEIYVVTDEGWSSLYARESGTWPIVVPVHWNGDW
jgi:hypothetical protein